MKILIATFTYPPNIDGVAEAARTMVMTFREAGHEVFVATFAANKTPVESTQDAAFVHRFHITGAPALLVGFNGEIRTYKDFIISLNPDIIVFHGWDTWPVEVALPLLPSLRARSILVSHGQSSHLLNPHILPRGLYKWLRWLPHVLSLPWRLRQFDKVVFLSQKTDLNRFFDAWVARWSGCHNTTTIPNTIDRTGWEAIPASFRQDELIRDGVFFLCVANYFPGKNQEMALQAFTQAHIPDSTLVFIGSTLGEYGERVREKWKQIKNRFPTLDVRFYEGMARHQIISATCSCDIAILASKTEAQPLTVLEAMACGKPFISTDVGCVSELKGGIIVHDIHGMVAAMKRLASDPDERIGLGTEAKRDFETHYSAEVTNRKWLSLLNEVSASL